MISLAEMRALRHPWLFLAMTVTVWLAIGVFVMAVVQFGQPRPAPLLALWLLLFAVYGLSLLASALIGRRSPKLHFILVMIESLAVIALAAVPHRGDPGPLLAPIALQMALIFGTERALKWVVLQSCLIWIARVGHLTDPEAWLYWALNLAAQIIAVGAVHLLRRETETAEALGQMNVELKAAQAMLADNAAIAERQRISRELHDAWGHDLTALSLQLEYASHAPSELGRAAIIEARDLAKSLLGKVRDVVGTLRRFEGHDIKPLLESLAASSPQLHVHVDIPENLARQPAEAAQTLLRAGQEIITNALRHAGARNLWLTVRVGDDGVGIEGRDDGAGVTQFSLGHGLSGLRERFESHGGKIAFETARGRGFRVTGWIPAPQRGS